MEVAKHPILEQAERHLEADRRYLQMIDELGCMLVPVPKEDGGLQLVWADIKKEQA